MDPIRSFAFYTLGCKLNFAESSYIGKTLLQNGFRKAEKGEAPDICVINTCTVTDTADKKCRQTIHKIRKQFPNTYLVVTGCYAQLSAPSIAQMEGVDKVLGANDKFEIPMHLRMQNHQPLVSDTKKMTPFHASCSAEDRTRHFLKVQDGCDYFCTYCAIPYARGRSRNGAIADLVKQAQEVAQNGGKEIILTGVNIGDFGKSTGETCLQLLQALDQVEGIERFRISSIEPNLLTDEIIDFVAHSKRFAPHFHIPLQAGSDAVLTLMHRRYDTALFAHKIHLIKEKLPHAFIGVDVIVGMRGETDPLFEESYQFIQSLPISELHVFSYSERAGTAALRIPYKVSPAVKKERSHRLLALSDQKKQAFYQSQIGTQRHVLWESTKKNGFMSGFTENYIKVKQPYQADKINTVNTIEITSELLDYEI
jgi:threonylcarbamoyladenosine tRNA methylthiotransferase MtaB